MTGSGLRQVVVAGGTGLVGRHLVPALLRAGARVTVLTRRPGPAAGLPDGVRTCGWSQLAEALAGADAVVNLCGEPVAGARWSPARKRRLETSRLDPTGQLVAALARPGGPRVLLNASAVGLYGPRDPVPVTEATAPGRDFLAGLCQRWEAAGARAEGHGVRVVALRLGVVLARDGGALPRMALPVRLGLGCRLGHGRQGLSWIHVDDLVAMILQALVDPDWRGPVNATAPQPVSSAAFTRALAGRLHWPVLPVPAWITAPALRLLLGEMGRAMLLEGAYVLPARATRLGFRWRFPDLDSALADLL